MGQRISSPSGTSMGQATPMQYGPVAGPAGSDRRSSSESNAASLTDTAGRRWSPSSPAGQHRTSADSAEGGGFVFSMFEENDLISPQVSRLHGRTIPEEKQRAFD
ncbi:gapN, partial [Symbiodinium pilosum]